MLKNCVGRKVSRRFWRPIPAAFPFWE